MKGPTHHHCLLCQKIQISVGNSRLCERRKTLRFWESVHSPSNNADLAVIICIHLLSIFWCGTISFQKPYIMNVKLFFKLLKYTVTIVGYVSKANCTFCV